MENTLTQSYGNLSTPMPLQSSMIHRFISWTNEQEKNRLAWVGFVLAFHGCILTPVTILITGLAGANFAYFMTAAVAIFMCLVVNLAAMPTKITIPVFFFSVLLDVIIIALCIAGGFNATALNIL
jgi:hypothetical protein